MLAHVQLLVHRQDGVRKRQLKFFNFSVLACTKYCQAWVRVKPLQQQQSATATLQNEYKKRSKLGGKEPKQQNPLLKDYI